MFIAESYRNRILKIKLIDENGVADSIEIFSKLPSNSSGRLEDNLPDGLTLYGARELCVAHYGMHAVQMLSETGALLLSINIGMTVRLQTKVDFC